MADRSDLINRIYYQELGRLNADPQGLDYWNSRDDLSDDELRRQIRGGAGLSGESVTQPLLADQSYSAFLRKMQFDESQIQSSLQAAQEAAQRRITGQAPIYNDQRQQSAEGINSGFEARQNRSGGRLRRLAEGRGRIDRNQQAFEQGIYDQKAKMERDSASQIASLRRSRAEQELGARDRLTQRSAQY